MGRRRHPHAYELAAWFDGEGEPETGDHLAGCRRCQRRTVDLRRVRAAVRGEPVAPALLVQPAWHRRPQLVSAALALILLLAAASAWGPINEPISEAGRYLTGQDDEAPPAAPTTTTGAAAVNRPAVVTSPPQPAPSAAPQTAPPLAGPGPATGGPSVVAAGGAPGATTPAPVARASDASPPSPGSAAAPDTALPPPATPLRLGSFVPMQGFEAGEGQYVAEAMRRSVARLNRAGGVAGRRVELVVADANNSAAVSALKTSADVLVGGYGAVPPPGLPWLLPADPLQGGPTVVTGELSPKETGSRLGTALAARDFDGAIGVVIGNGPDMALADGLASALPVLRAVARPHTSCDEELFSLRRRGVRALAVAGSPDLAGRCADAAARMAWRPRGGLLMPPDAVYAHLEDRLTVAGARTVLGLPWPTEDRPPARYRADMPGPPSYRALVSYAAVELAAQVAAQHGTVNAERVRASRWSTDLYDVGAGRAEPEMVVASLGRWTAARNDYRRSRNPDEW